MENEEVLVLKNILQMLKDIRESNREFVRYMRDAETEVPEFLRRFANYMHDLHHIKFVYEEHGQHPPDYVFRELERCDDRYRQILDKLNAAGGALEKVRREMAADPLNKWDHTRLLPKKENGNEAGKRE